MNDKRSRENWELEEGDDVEDRWVLDETEQQVTEQWQLQDEQGPAHEWQPVEYTRPRRAGPAWLLPSVVTVALLAVLGYAGWVLIPQIFTAATTGTPTATSPADNAVAQGESTPTLATTTEEPTEVVPVETAAVDSESTGAPATVPAPEGTETPVGPGQVPQVDQQIATVISTYGVNARREPSVDAEIIRILEQGQTFFVFEVQGEWIKLFVNESQLVEGEPISGTVGYAAAEFFQISKQLLPESFVDEILAYAGELPEPTPEAAAVTSTPSLGQATATPGGLLPTPTATPTPTVAAGVVTPGVGGVAATVDAESGLNIRTEPNVVADVVALLEDGETLPAVRRTADNRWIQVQLPDGAVGWAFADFLTISGDIGSLPLIGEEPEAPAQGAISSSTVITTGVVPPQPYSNVIPQDSPAVIVPNLEGVNARTAADAEAEVVAIVPQGAALPARGLSADDQWIQVQLPFGRLAWVFGEAVTTTPDVEDLPVVGEAETTADEPSASDTITATATIVEILVSVYPEPSVDVNNIAVVARGTQLPVTGRNLAGDWLQVRSSGGALGWILEETARLDVDLEDLPIVQ